MFSASIRTKYNIFYLVAALLWPLLKVQFLNGIDGAGRVEMLLMFFAVIINGRRLIKIPNAVFVWGIWIIYSIINSSVKGFHLENVTLIVWAIKSLIFPFITLLVAYRVSLTNYSRVVKAMFVAYLFYLIIGMFGLAEYVEYDDSTRMANNAGNAYFNSLFLLPFYAILAFQQRKIGKILYIIALLLAIAVVLYSGERKALIALFVIIVASIYVIIKQKSKHKFYSAAIVSMIAAVCFFLVMQYSTFGQRMEYSMAESDYSNNLFLKLVGDRAIMYIEGWDFFLHNIWTGIGLTQYAHLSQIGLLLHTEYMVQLCECGIIGSLLFIIFYGSMIKKVIRIRKEPYSKNLFLIYFSFIIAILIINLVSWTYDSADYFAAFGLIFASCAKTNNRSVIIRQS